MIARACPVDLVAAARRASSARAILALNYADRAIDGACDDPDDYRAECHDQADTLAALADILSDDADEDGLDCPDAELLASVAVELRAYLAPPDVDEDSDRGRRVPRGWQVAS